MKKLKFMKPIIGILCVIVLLLAAALAVYLDSRSPNPILGIFQTDPTEPEDVPSKTPDDEIVTPPDLPPSVDILPEDGDQGLTFPCQVPGYDLVIEKLAPYSGLFVEDGRNTPTQSVAMLMLHNNGGFPLEYTQISVQCGEETLLFDISALPAGQRLVVQEKNGKPMPEAPASSANAMVVRRANMDMSADKVRVVDNGDNTLTVQNLTDKDIPTVRIFYKYYMEDESVFVGGIAFTVRITRLGAGASMTLQPSHYTSLSSRVVMVLTYETEV